MTNLAVEKGDLLIVDDQPHNLRLLFTTLAQEGYEVRRVLSGKQALQVVDIDPPDLILMDVKMPEMDGYEACQHIKTNPKAQDIPVIFLSASGEIVNKVKAFEVGGADYLTKPFELAEVIARIEHQLALQRLQQQLKTQNELLQQRTQELETANKDLEAFNFTITHDLRAPLRTMQAMTSAVLEDYQDQLDPEAIDFLSRVVQASHHLDQLTLDLLTYSRLGKSSLELEPVNVEEIVERTLKELASQIEASQATIDVSPLPPVQAQYTLLNQILLNLISNALKFHKPDIPPKITIRGETSPTTVRLLIQDNGIGIKPAAQDRIFNVFERLHGQEEYPGTGIGLAIVQRGMSRLGGKVGLESTAGEGSSFWLEFPRPV